MGGATVVQSAILEIAGRDRPRLQHPAGRGEPAAVCHAQSGPERGGRPGGGGGESAAVLRGLRHRRRSGWSASSRSHGDGVLRVDAELIERAGFPRCLVDERAEFDALITDLPGLALVVSTADCLPILIHDPVRRAVAAVHAGWRGTAKRIAAQALAAMRRGVRDGSSRLPGGDRARDSRLLFRSRCRRDRGDGGRPAELGDACEANRAGHWLLDLVGINRALLEAAGLCSDRIEDVELCTSCRNDLFFSHRAEKGRTGRMMNFILLRAESRDRELREG